MTTKARWCRWCRRRRVRKNPRRLFCCKGCLKAYEEKLGHWHWNWEGTELDTQLWRRADKPVWPRCWHWYLGAVYPNTGFQKETFLMLAEEREVDLSWLELVEAVWAGSGFTTGG